MHSPGIGEQIAYKYAEAGAMLIISARSTDKLSNVRNNSLVRGASAVHVVPQDFSKVHEIKDFRTKVKEIYPNIDIMVLNHAAIPMGSWTAFPNQRDSEFVLRTFNINILSYIELSTVFLSDLERSRGQIQVTGSLSGWAPYYEAGLYTSTKHAVNGFFYSLQQELHVKQSSVSVSVFSLGLIITPELGTLLASEPEAQKIPGFIKGDVVEVAEIVASSALYKPRNVDYPIGSVKIARLTSYLFPRFIELLIGAFGWSYSAGVEAHSRIHKLGDEINYQIGNK